MPIIAFTPPCSVNNISISIYIYIFLLTLCVKLNEVLLIMIHVIYLNCQGVGVSLCFPPVLITVPSPNVSQLFLVVFVI